MDQNKESSAALEAQVNMFTTLNEHELKLKELRSVFVDHTDMDKSKGAKETLHSSLKELKTDSRRFFNFVKTKMHIKRKEKQTFVEDICIVQEEDNETWARRSASSAASRSSIDSKLSAGSSCSSTNNQNLKVVNDLEYDYSI